MAALLELKGVTKRFRGLTAVDNLDFEVHQGETLGLIGPNGSGKTTVFNLITGFCKPEEGVILYKGENITGLLPHRVARKGIARTFQIVKPFKKMTVVESVKVGALLRIPNMREAEEKAESTLEFVGLSGLKHELAQNLTVANQKRVSLAGALATDPELMLIDEVVAGLNDKEIEELLKTLRKVGERGVTMLLVEHVMRFIMSVSDRIVVLNYGQKICEGKPKDIICNKEVIEAYLGKDYGAT